MYFFVGSYHLTYLCIYVFISHISCTHLCESLADKISYISYIRSYHISISPKKLFLSCLYKMPFEFVFSNLDSARLLTLVIFCTRILL